MKKRIIKQVSISNPLTFDNLQSIYGSATIGCFKIDEYDALESLNPQDFILENTIKGLTITFNINLARPSK